MTLDRQRARTGRDDICELENRDMAVRSTHVSLEFIKI